MGRPKALAWQAPVIFSVILPTNASILTAPNCSVFVADTDYELEEVTEVHETLGTNGSAVTLDIVKCTTTQAASAGTTMLASTFDLKATINTLVRKTKASGLTTTRKNLLVVRGDRIALAFSGTLTALTGVCVQFNLKPLRRVAY